MYIPKRAAKESKTKLKYQIKTNIAKHPLNTNDL